MQHGVRRSELKPRGPRNDLNIGTRRFRGARSAPPRALSPMASTTNNDPGGRNAPKSKLFGAQPGDG
eukprot:15438678-Alexandrium_andersonii.AAC.1